MKGSWKTRAPPPLNEHDDDPEWMTFASNEAASFIDLDTPSSPLTFARHRKDSFGLDEDDSARPPSSRKADIRIVTDDSSSEYFPKPPLPTTPKPNFRRSASAGPSKPRSRGPSAAHPEPIPPTTNYLSAEARADLVRKSRKLTQVFGTTPSVDHVQAPRQHTRGSLSVAEGLGSPTRGSLRSRSSVSSNDSRRFSAPPSPLDTASLADMLGDAQIADTSRSLRKSGRSRRAASPGDRRSFIDLSDEEASMPEDSHRPELKRPTSPSGLSLASLTTIETAQENRRKQRDRLAKLHRYLGSRVPAELILGPIADDTSLPSPEPVFEPPTQETDPKAWKRLRRRSSSAAEMKTRWFDDGERVKANLDEREKALNVRRAVKMEKLFGVPPPQTLYTRATSPGATSPILASPTSRNPNQSAYLNKGKAIAGWRTPRRRTSTASESRQNLLSEDAPSNPFDDPSPSLHSRRASSVYMQYRLSLNSLNDMIDRDDKESIAEIHQYLTSTSELSPASDDEDPRTTTPTPTNTTNTPSPVPSTSDSSSLKSLRRRSLPVRASQLSLASQFTNGEEPTMKTFQTRRRRAAKLTSFFGVDYRMLVGDILESIEEDVEQESRRGALQPHEAQDLLQKLRKLKTKRL